MHGARGDALGESPAPLPHLACCPPPPLYASSTSARNTRVLGPLDAGRCASQGRSEGGMGTVRGGAARPSTARDSAARCPCMGHLLGGRGAAPPRPRPASCASKAARLPAASRLRLLTQLTFFGFCPAPSAGHFFSPFFPKRVWDSYQSPKKLSQPAPARAKDGARRRRGLSSLRQPRRLRREWLRSAIGWGPLHAGKDDPKLLAEVLQGRVRAGRYGGRTAATARPSGRVPCSAGACVAQPLWSIAC